MKLTTIENVVDEKAATLLKSFRSIKIVYTNKNIFIKTLYMDNKFEVLWDYPRDKGLTLNTFHLKKLPQIERQIKVVRERFCSTWYSLPYQKHPNRMIYRMVENTVFWINALPTNREMSCTIPPWTLMTETTIYFAKHCKIQFGAYAKSPPPATQHNHE